MGSFKQTLVLLASLATFGYTFYVMAKLMCFLSKPRSISKTYTWVFNLLDNKSRLETAYGAIVIDTLYLLAFIFQHSLMKSSMVKKLWEKLGLLTAERTIYSFASSLALHVSSMVCLCFCTFTYFVYIFSTCCRDGWQRLPLHCGKLMWMKINISIGLLVWYML